MLFCRILAEYAELHWICERASLTVTVLKMSKCVQVAWIYWFSVSRTLKLSLPFFFFFAGCNSKFSLGICCHSSSTGRHACIQTWSEFELAPSNRCAAVLLLSLWQQGVPYRLLCFWMTLFVLVLHWGNPLCTGTGLSVCPVQSTRPCVQQTSPLRRHYVLWKR